MGAVSLVLALAALMILAEAATIGARTIRQSAGLTVLVTAMALLGPAPAVAIAIPAMLGETLVNRVRWPEAMTCSGTRRCRRSCGSSSDA